MCRSEGREPVCSGAAGAIELTIAPQEKDIGEFSVHRVLPSAARRALGAFVFFGQMGSAQFPCPESTASSAGGVTEPVAGRPRRGAGWASGRPRGGDADGGR